MNQDSDFTKTEKKVFLSLTGKDVDRVQLVSILEALDDKFRDRLAPYPECDDLFKPLLQVLGLRNQIRMYALLAITARGLTLKSESAYKRIRNLIDLEFDWTRSPSREFYGDELKVALKYKSRAGFQKLRRKWNVSGKALGKGASKTYSRALHPTLGSYFYETYRGGLGWVCEPLPSVKPAVSISVWGVFGAIVAVFTDSDTFCSGAALVAGVRDLPERPKLNNPLNLCRNINMNPVALAKSN